MITIITTSSSNPPPIIISGFFIFLSIIYYLDIKTLKKMLYRVASFDPGKKNFALCVEEFETDMIKEQYCSDGTCSDSFQTRKDYFI